MKSKQNIKKVALALIALTLVSACVPAANSANTPAYPTSIGAVTSPDVDL